MKRHLARSRVREGLQSFQTRLYDLAEAELSTDVFSLVSEYVFGLSMADKKRAVERELMQYWNSGRICWLPTSEYFRFVCNVPTCSYSQILEYMIDPMVTEDGVVVGKVIHEEQFVELLMEWFEFKGFVRHVPHFGAIDPNWTPAQIRRGRRAVLRKYGLVEIG